MRKDRRNPFADRPGKIRFDHDFARCRILQSAYHHILKRCRQREHRQLCVGRADFGYDHGAQICANDVDQAIMIGCLLGGERDAGENTQAVSQRDAVCQQRFQQARHGGERQWLRRDGLDQLSMPRAQMIDKVAYLVRPEKILRACGKQLVDLRGDHAFRIDREVSFGNSQVPRTRVDPQGRATEARIDCRFTWNGLRMHDFSRVDSQHVAGLDFATADGRAAQSDAVAVGLDLEAVLDPELGNDEAEILAHLLAQSCEPRDQRGATLLIRHADKPVTHQDGDQRLVGHVLDPDMSRIGSGHRFRNVLRGMLALAQSMPQAERASRKWQNDRLRHGRNTADCEKNAGTR